MAEAGLLRFIPPKHEFRDGILILKTADGRVLELPVREFLKLKPRELAERLNLKAVPLKELAAWKGEVLRSYIGLQPLRERVRFSLLQEIYTHTRPLLVGDELVGIEIEFTVWEGRVRRGRPLFIVDFDGYLNVNRREYSLAKARAETVVELVRSAPAELLNRLWKLVGGRKGGEEGDGLEELVEKLLSANAVYEPVPTLRSAEFLENLDWRGFAEEALSFGAGVDRRLMAVRACHALKGVEGRYLPHAIVVGNSGSGKSQFYKIWGQHWDKVTANTLIGFAKGRDEVYFGLIHGAEEVIAVDQVESADRGNFVRYLMDYLEDGECSFAAGGVLVHQEGRAPLVFIANPIGSGGEKDFQRTVETISYNPALGARIGIVFYFTDLAVIRGTEEALTPEDEERWRQVKAIVRAVEDYCRRELRRIWKHPKVLDWLRRPIPDYAKRVNEIIGTLESETLREFFQNHASQAAPKIRAAALQAALLYNLKDVALGRCSVEAVLEEAERWLKTYVELNLASIANIVADYIGKRERNAKAFFETLPDYLKAVVATAEAYRRAVLEEWRGRGQVPDELRSLVLDALKVSVQEYGYNYLSQALDRIKRWKGAAKYFHQLQEYFGLKLTLLEGPKPQLQLHVLRWEEAPIELPERLVGELKTVLEKGFLGFSVFSVSRPPVEKGVPPSRSENAESIPSGAGGTSALHETARNRENRETEKQEPLSSFQDERAANTPLPKYFSEQFSSSLRRETLKREPTGFRGVEKKESGLMRCPLCGRYYAAARGDSCPHCQAVLEDALARGG